MCLYTKSVEKVAENDLYTITVLNCYPEDNLKSPYQDVKYKLGELKTVNSLRKRALQGEVIRKGLHSYIDCKHHCFGEIYDKYKLYICKIPKGSRYYIGIYSDIVSDNLIVLELGYEVHKNSPTNYVSFKYAFKKALKLLESKYGKQSY